jgi:hypothetical protein
MRVTPFVRTSPLAHILSVLSLSLSLSRARALSLSFPSCITTLQACGANENSVIMKTRTERQEVRSYEGENMSRHERERNMRESAQKKHTQMRGSAQKKQTQGAGPREKDKTQVSHKKRRARTMAVVWGLQARMVGKTTLKMEKTTGSVHMRTSSSQSDTRQNWVPRNDTTVTFLSRNSNSVQKTFSSSSSQGAHAPPCVPCR